MSDAALVKGVGPDTPIIESESGYRTSQVPYRMNLMFWRAILHTSEIMAIGAQSHGEDNWRKGSADDHLNKALIHLAAHYIGDTSDDHLGHAAWRVMAALEIELANKKGDPVASESP